MAIRKGFAFLGSYGLSVALLLLLALLTLLGTLEQVDQGLYAVQKKYFESVFLVHRFFGVAPVPLPGAYLLMVLLFANLFCGGILRARRGWRHAGIFIAHAGILVLLAGAFISFKFSERGHVTLYEGEQSSEYVSYDTWEVALAPAAPGEPITEHLIPAAGLAAARDKRAITFHAQGLPFDLTLSGHSRNALPLLDTGAGEGEFRLHALEPEREAEQNLPGVQATLREKTSGMVHEGLLWGGAREPWAVAVAGQVWTVDLRRRTRSLPFTLQLDAFTRERYPGTDIPKAFTSEVTCIEAGGRQPARISMNAPLRHRGYTLYQASWGPAGAGPAERLYSSLAVVRNPADQIPLYACCVICLGLLAHFCQKLAGYLRAAGRDRT